MLLLLFLTLKVIGVTFAHIALAQTSQPGKWGQWGGADGGGGIGAKDGGEYHSSSQVAQSTPVDHRFIKSKHVLRSVYLRKK